MFKIYTFATSVDDTFKKCRKFDIYKQNIVMRMYIVNKIIFEYKNEIIHFPYKTVGFDFKNSIIFQNVYTNLQSITMLFRFTGIMVNHI